MQQYEGKALLYDDVLTPEHPLYVSKEEFDPKLRPHTGKALPYDDVLTPEHPLY